MIFVLELGDLVVFRSKSIGLLCTLSASEAATDQECHRHHRPDLEHQAQHRTTERVTLVDGPNTSANPATPEEGGVGIWELVFQKNPVTKRGHQL